MRAVDFKDRDRVLEPQSFLTSLISERSLCCIVCDYSYARFSIVCGRTQVIVVSRIISLYICARCFYVCYFWHQVHYQGQTIVAVLLNGQ